MSDRLRKSIEQVLQNENCTGCGGCTLVSPRVTMSLKDNGWMRPRVDGEVSARESTAEARRFRGICPGVRLQAAAAPVGGRSHPTFGRYMSAWKGVALDKEVRDAGSSAGVLTALSAYLLSSGRAQFVRGAAMSPSEPRRTVPVRIMTRAEALEASGSRYAPVSVLDGATDMGGAIVGKPCEIAALRQLNDDDSENVTLSFFCAGTPSQAATDRLVGSLGIDALETTNVRYRGNGWPGEFTATDGIRSASLTYDDSWGKHLGRDLQWRCKICPDGTGEAADVAVGDFWHADAKGYPLFDTAEGESVVIARTVRGHELLIAAAEAGVVALSEVDLDDVERIQPLQRDRKRTLAVRLLARALSFKRIPSFRGYGILGYALKNPKLSARTFAGTFVRSWRDRRKGRHT